jgi:ketosteroid isomerase-like protein
MGAAKDLWDEYQAVYAKLDYTALASFYAVDAVHIDPNGRHEGREAIGAYIKEGDTPFSDITMVTSQLIEEGNRS